MSFIDSRFPTDIAYGRAGGPENNTRVARTPGGKTQRQALMAQSLRAFDISYGLKTLDDLHAVTKHFEAMRGRLHSFPFKDHADYLSCDPGDTISATDVLIGSGDGETTTFQLVKKYTVGSQTVSRKIYLPIVSTVLIAVGGVAVTEGWSVSRPGGVITFEEAPGGSPAEDITAGFEYDVEVYFDIDRMPTTLDTISGTLFAGNIDSILLREERR